MADVQLTAFSQSDRGLSPRRNSIGPVFAIGIALLTAGIFAKVVGLDQLQSSLANQSPSSYRWAQILLDLGPWFMASGIVIVIIACTAVAIKYVRS
jgi:hypothetical protein